MIEREGLLEINKSKFYYFRISGTAADFQRELDKIKAEHKKATHVCYAYSFEHPFEEKCCDDGEPKGTAGSPILSVIKKKKLANVGVIVVRYFGGIKLGAGGLVRAYTKSASLALSLEEKCSSQK